MIIKTKYNLMDKVWVLRNNKAQELVIGFIKASVTDQNKAVEYGLHQFSETHGVIQVHHHIETMKEGKFFETKEELLKSL